MKRKLLQLLGGSLIALFAYYTYTVLEARSNTLNIVENAKAQISNPISKRDLSEDQLKKLIVIQDPNFLSHGGTDFTNKRITTITQSLVKFLYFEKFKPGIAKIRQSLIARYALDPLVSKEEQLDLFLNLTYFGEFEGKQIRGFNTASHIYFGKALQDLSETEFLQLLAMLWGPNLYNIKNNPEKNAEQVELIRKQLSS